MTMIRRKLKNAVNKYTDAEIKVREATSNDPWGPSSTLMASISDLTYQHSTYSEVMSMIWRRINDKQNNWRHIYKALVLLEYIVKTGSSHVAEECHEYMHSLQSLHDFECYEENKDQGLCVREKSKALVNLLKDNSLLAAERERALMAKQRLNGSQTPQQSSLSSRGTFKSNKKKQMKQEMSEFQKQAYDEMSIPKPTNDSGMVDEDIQLQIALAISKEAHEEEEKKRQQEEAKLKMAIEESRLDEEKARKVAQEKETEAKNPSSSKDPWDAYSTVSAAKVPWTSPPTSATNDPWLMLSNQESTPAIEWTNFKTTVDNGIDGTVTVSAAKSQAFWTATSSALVSNDSQHKAVCTSGDTIPWMSSVSSNGSGDPWSASAKVSVPQSESPFDRRSSCSTDPWGGTPSSEIVLRDSANSIQNVNKTDNQLSRSLNSSEPGHTSKKPQDKLLNFDPALVNLDNLTIGNPKKAATNPFLTTTVSSSVTPNSPPQSNFATSNPFMTSPVAPVAMLPGVPTQYYVPMMSQPSVPNPSILPVNHSVSYPAANNPWSTGQTFQAGPSHTNPFL